MDYATGRRKKRSLETTEQDGKFASVVFCNKLFFQTSNDMKFHFSATFSV